MKFLNSGISLKARVVIVEIMVNVGAPGASASASASVWNDIPIRCGQLGEIEGVE